MVEAIQQMSEYEIAQSAGVSAVCFIVLVVCIGWVVKIIKEHSNYEDWTRLEYYPDLASETVFVSLTIACVFIAIACAGLFYSVMILVNP